MTRINDLRGTSVAAIMIVMSTPQGDKMASKITLQDLVEVTTDNFPHARKGEQGRVGQLRSDGTIQVHFANGRAYWMFAEDISKVAGDTRITTYSGIDYEKRHRLREAARRPGLLARVRARAEREVNTAFHAAGQTPRVMTLAEIEQELEDAER